ncbi:MAG: phosphoribosylanthranilate isomerase [Gemmatimonadaceae bacterium]
MKFCGLTRAEDAALGAELGAAYLGVIFAGGPRLQTPDAAKRVLDGSGSTAKRVGVFGASSAAEIARIARTVALDIVQLHSDPTARDIAAVRQETDARIWAVVRVTDTLPPDVGELISVADALLVDARVSGSLGGTGVPVDWDALSAQLDVTRSGRPVILAGGLAPENVARAIRTLRPDVVDVSSGVELAPGLKDHARMRAFATAVADAAKEK